MNGSTLVGGHPSSRTHSFERPSPLKIPVTTASDFGKNPWDSHRGLWQSNGSVASRTNASVVDRPNIFQQNSISSTHHPRASTGAALSPIDNLRSTAKLTSNPWSSSTASPLGPRQQGPLLSPAKPRHQPWSFSDSPEFDSENSVLLRGSAPDIDPMDEPTTHTSYAINERSHFATQNGGDSLSFLLDQNGRDHHPVNSNAFNSNPSIDRSSVTVRHRNGAAHATRNHLNSRQSGTALAHVTGSQHQSPTPAGYGRAVYRDNHPHRTQKQGFSLLDNTIDPMRGLTLNSHSSSAQNGRGMSDPFKLSEYIPEQSSQPGVNGATPHMRLSAAHADFHPSGYPNSYEVANEQILPSHYPSMWAYSGQGTPRSSDFQNNNYEQYYSAEATPPTGPESGRSAGGSGISSRTSHYDFSLVNRKLDNMDAFQQSSFHQGNGLVSTNGLVSANGSTYDYSLTPNGMNPLAGTYTPYSLSAFSASSIGGYPPAPRMPLREQEAQVTRSPLLEDFRMNSKTNKRYELRDIFNHVVEFSGDQHGSRFIQQKLETANSDEKDQIFKEIQSDCIQLMTDVFGNYVIQKLFEHGNQSQKKQLANHMKGHVLTLSTQMYGCRVVQKALEHVLTDQQASMVKELDGPNKQILKVIRDQNGNHVVQKAIERVSAEHIHFIIEAHRGEAVKLAQHTYGCRVIQRILENCQPAAKRIILDELHGCVAPLITDQFGNYVVQHIIAKGEPKDRRHVVSIVSQQILNFSKHKFASNVVETCIENADDDQRAEIFRGLVEPNDQGQTPVLGLLRDQYGNYVIQKVHALLKGSQRDTLVNEMKVCLPQLKRTSYGKQVMAIEKLLYGISNAASAHVDSCSSTQTSNSPGSNNDHHRTLPQLHRTQQAFQHEPEVLSVFNTFGRQ